MIDRIFAAIADLLFARRAIEAERKEFARYKAWSQDVARRSLEERRALLARIGELEATAAADEGDRIRRAKLAKFSEN